MSTSTSSQEGNINKTMHYIDLHSHLLPGIDDGCRTLAESVACIQRLQENGFVGSVCTPHYLRDQFPHNTPRTIARGVAHLREHLDAEKITYQLWSGAEARIAADTIDWFETTGVPTLGDSRFVLVDYWGQSWPDFGDTVLDYLVERDYVPILAHPERMEFPDDDWYGIVDKLHARRVLLQGNLNSFYGGEGERPRQRMHWLCEQDGYHVLASDTHRPDALDGRMAGIGMLEDHLGEISVRTMMGQRPHAIMHGADLK